MTSNKVDPYAKAPFSGQATGQTGTAQALPQVSAARFLISALPDNSSTVYIGNSTGSLDPNNGFALAMGSEPIELEGLNDLSDLSLFVLTGGDGVGFLALYDPKQNPLI